MRTGVEMGGDEDEGGDGDGKGGGDGDGDVDVDVDGDGDGMWTGQGRTGIEHNTRTSLNGVGYVANDDIERARVIQKEIVGVFIMHTQTLILIYTFVPFRKVLAAHVTNLECRMRWKWRWNGYRWDGEFEVGVDRDRGGVGWRYRWR